MKKDCLRIIISWLIVIFFAISVEVGYKENYQDIFIFLALLVVLLPLIFSVTWVRGILGAIISFFGILVISFLFWGIKSFDGDFGFENHIPYLEMIVSALKGIVLGAFLKFLYVGSKKIGKKI